MTEIKQNIIKKIVNSSWFITLISTMIGVIAGFYLTDYNEKRKLLNGRDEAMKIVINELDDNQSNLQIFNDSLKIYYQPFFHVMSYYDIKEETIIISKDSLDSFIEKTKLVFTFSKAEPHSKDKISINGVLELNFTSKFLIADLSHIVWDAYKQSSFISATQFSCLREIEGIYQLQDRVDKENEEWFDTMLELARVQNISTIRNLLDKWKMMLDKQNMLLQIYEQKEFSLENCN